MGAAAYLSYPGSQTAHHRLIVAEPNSANSSPHVAPDCTSDGNGAGNAVLGVLNRHILLTVGGNGSWGESPALLALMDVLACI